jgi:hypothetical protein
MRTKPRTHDSPRPARRATILWALALVTPLAVACQAARLPVPDSLAAAERLPVTGRQGLQLRPTLRFGSFEAGPIARSWTRGRDRGATTLALKSERRQTFEFTLHDGGEPHWFVACRAQAHRVRIDLGLVDVHPSEGSALYCNLQSTADRMTAWEMELKERRGRPLTGTLAHRGDRYDVVGTNRPAGALPMDGTVGYELRNGAGVVGAVEVVNRGAVWLHPGIDAETRRLLAAAATALLLLDELYTTMNP